MGVSDIIEDILLQIHNGIGIIHPYNPLYGGFPLVTGTPHVIDALKFRENPVKRNG